MSIEYSVNIMKGIFVNRNEIYRLAERFGFDDLNFRDEEALSDLLVVIKQLPEFKSIMEHLSVHTLYSEDASQQPDGVIVAQKSSFIYNDSKHGGGELFNKVVLSGRDLIDLDPEKEMLKKFRKEFRIENKIDTIITGEVN